MRAASISARMSPNSAEGATGEGSATSRLLMPSPPQRLSAGDCLVPIRHQFGGFPHGLVLGVDVEHEHHHSLVRRQSHADLDRDARIGNVGRRAVADAVRPHMCRTRRFERTTPATVDLPAGNIGTWRQGLVPSGR